MSFVILTNCGPELARHGAVNGREQLSTYRACVLNPSRVGLRNRIVRR